MKISKSAYQRLAKFVGGLLTLMGLGVVSVFLAFIVTGNNALANSAVALDGAGLIILASIGAFTLPLGLSLFSADKATSARLEIAAGALEIMALIRLTAFLNPEIREVVGFTPLVEFFVLGGLGVLAYLVRPEDESPIECHIDLELDVPASEAWHVLGEKFGDVDDIASGVQKSTMSGEVDVGAVRTCEIAEFGPFSSTKVTEELIEFRPGEMKFAYVAGGGLPAMIPTSTNRWSIEALDEGRCRVRSHATIELKWWALPFAKLLGWSIRSEIRRFSEELRHRLERGTPHPRTVAARAKG